MTRSVGVLASLGCLLALLTQGKGAAPPVLGPPWALLPGGVADAEGKVGYVTNPEGRVDALDLSTGKVLWQSSVQCRPLALVGDRLVGWVPAPAELLPTLTPSGLSISHSVPVPPRPGDPPAKANRFCVVILDVNAQGRLVSESAPVVLPQWADVSHPLQCGFSINAGFHKGRLSLGWVAIGCYQRLHLPPEIKPVCPESTGEIEVNLERGKAGSPRETKVPKKHNLPRGLAVIYSYGYLTATAWQADPLVLGDRAVLFHCRREGGAETLLHQVADLKGNREPERQLARGRSGRSFILTLSLDQTHVAVNYCPEKGPGDDNIVSVFDVATGERIVTLPAEPDARCHQRVGQRVFSLIEKHESTSRTRTLRAYDRRTGKLLWQRPVWSPPPHVPTS
jgi:hypothetical protein